MFHNDDVTSVIKHICVQVKNVSTCQVTVVVIVKKEFNHIVSEQASNSAHPETLLLVDF